MGFENNHIQDSQHNVVLAGSKGLPPHYPIPQDIDNLLFFIQRNLNENTVVYELNINRDGHINLSDPINAYWIKYTEGNREEKLNYIQEKLAYGYKCKVINNESIEIQIVSYPEFRIFVGKNENDKFTAYYIEDGIYYKLTNIYVYAEDFGVFPDVQYVDIHGIDLDSNKTVKHKIEIS